MSNFVGASLCPRGGQKPRARGGESDLYSNSGGRKYLNVAERRRVLDTIDALPREQALFALTLAWTGARVSEVLSLRLEAFQVELGMVAIRTLKRRRFAIREVPLPQALMLALNDHYRLNELQREPDSAGRLLWPWCRQTGWRVIKQVMASAGVSGPRACPRGLRHAFGVCSLQSGVPLNLVQRWLGHASLTTTAIYASASGPEERALAARFWRSGEAPK